MVKQSDGEIRKVVSEHYGARARERLAAREATEQEAAAAAGDSCCEPTCCDSSESPPLEEALVQRLYSTKEVRDLPEEALSSLGCGNPTAIAGLKEGEHVLDLGSGGGLDCFLAAQKVGPSGKAVGLDMTPDMLDLARRNAEKVGLSNVEFHKGEMEKMPFPDATFDVIISNCVINLSPDKDAVFRESFRVLKPGGRFRISDIVWLRTPTEQEKTDLENWAACIAGALTADEYASKLTEAGFSDVRAQLADDGGDRGFTSAYVEAEKAAASQRKGEPVVTLGTPAAASSEGAIRLQRRCC